MVRLISDGFTYPAVTSVIKVSVNALPTTVDDEPVIPDEFNLRQNYPNPFNPETKIEYVVPTTTSVNITIYNLLGRKSERL